MGWLLQLQLQLLLLGSESSEEDVPLHQGDVLAPDDDDWDPTKDSDYEDAPKKKKQKKAASSSKKAGSSSSGKKKQKKRRSTSSDSESDEGDDVGAAGQQQPQSMEQEKVAKAAAAALRSIKSNINSQMVSRKRWVVWRRLVVWGWLGIVNNGAACLPICLPQHSSQHSPSLCAMYVWFTCTFSRTSQALSVSSCCARC